MEADVKIVDLYRPDDFGINNFDRLQVILQNNESVPVNVGIEVKNAYVNEITLPASGVKISGQELKEEIILPPGKNTVIAYLAYEGSGTQTVEIKVFQKRRLIDAASFNIEVPRSLISLQMDYEIETNENFDLYRVNGYLTKEGTDKAHDVVTKITISDDKTGEIISTNTDARRGLQPEQKTSISIWKGRPAAYIELARNQSSDETYMPILSVAKGKIGDRYRVNVAAIWKARIVYAEMVIPPA